MKSPDKLVTDHISMKSPDNKLQITFSLQAQTRDRFHVQTYQKLNMNHYDVTNDPDKSLQVRRSNQK